MCAKKISGTPWELHLKVQVNQLWHIYSQTTPDGGPVATTVVFTKNPLLGFEGTVKENGKLISRHEDVFGVDVKYFEDQVDFVQTLKVRGSVKTTVNGVLCFMVCNDKECLPPTEQKFAIAL